MARVVQQRSNPPYLLILFVFLFLITSVLAVFQFVRADNVAKELRQEQEARRKIANNSQMNEFSRVINNYTGSEDSTVIGYLKKQVEARNTLIVGDKQADADQIKAAQERIAGLSNLQAASGNIQAGLIGMLVRANEEIGAANARLAKRDEDESALKLAIQAKEKELKDAKDQLAKQLAQHTEAVNKAREDRAKAEAGLTKNIADLKAQKDQDIAMLNKNIADQARKIQELERTLRDKEIEVADLKSKQPTGDDKASDVPAYIHAAGQITKVVARDNICYINIGKQNRVRPGLTFSVFASDAAFNAEKAKANIVVDNVSDNFSACRILSTDKNQTPVQASDVIVNPTFSHQQALKFVVQGIFDLHGTGRPTVQGAAEVKALIARNGGQLVERLDHSVDYLVMGEAPPTPAPARDDEPPAVTAAREQMMRDVEAFNASVEEAAKLQIPVLNANRFLVLTGFEPASVGSK
ncbi:MAG: hypothetical protein GXY38_07020 [Planctomycetes bacterium]|jgi:hypothetical protein|nr:hypothetical protein [Planctomycetota bacterium]